MKVLLGATLDMLAGESPKRPFSLAQPRQGKCGSSSVVQVCKEERGGEGVNTFAKEKNSNSLKTPENYQRKDFIILKMIGAD